MFAHNTLFGLLINFVIITISTGAYYNHRHLDKFLTRHDWLAIDPSEEIDNLIAPVSRIIVAHTATPGCETKVACTKRVRSIQNYHMNSKHWSDIGYNFLIGGDGGVYIGRGWDKIGTHTAGENSDSIGVALIGNFTQYLPSRNQLSALKYLIEKGVHEKKLSSDYVIYPHRALVATESPGDKVVAAIDKWSRYYTNSNVPDLYVRSEMEDVTDSSKN